MIWTFNCESLPFVCKRTEQLLDLKVGKPHILECRLTCLLSMVSYRRKAAQYKPQ